MAVDVLIQCDLDSAVDVQSIQRLALGAEASSQECLLSQSLFVFYGFLSFWVVRSQYSNSICVSKEGIQCG